MNILIQIINYYNLLFEYYLNNCYKFMKTQIKQVDKKFNQDYFDWNIFFKDVNIWFSLQIQSVNNFIEFTSANK